MRKKNVLAQFRQQEAESIALSVKLNHWSQVMIAQMIAEIEQKLVASDLPVEGDDVEVNFWEAMV